MIPPEVAGPPPVALPKAPAAGSVPDEHKRELKEIKHCFMASERLLYGRCHAPSEFLDSTKANAKMHMFWRCPKRPEERGLGRLTETITPSDLQ